MDGHSLNEILFELEHQNNEKEDCIEIKNPIPISFIRSKEACLEMIDTILHEVQQIDRQCEIGKACLDYCITLFFTYRDKVAQEARSDEEATQYLWRLDEEITCICQKFVAWTPPAIPGKEESSEEWNRCSHQSLEESKFMIILMSVFLKAYKIEAFLAPTTEEINEIQKMWNGIRQIVSPYMGKDIMV